MSQPWRKYPDRRTVRSPEYHAWAAMKTLCSNKYCHAFHLYGGRGVRVCQQWLTFGGFFKDMGKRPSSKHRLTLLNRSGNFEPGNVAWRTR
jgi:hypothetical protein